MVIESFDKQRFITVDEEVYFMKEVQKNAKTSPDLDPEPVEKPKPKAYKPPMSHPWKRQSFILQQERAHKKKQYA